MEDYASPELHFTVFVIHALAEAWHKSVPEVFELLEKYAVVENYLYPCYDTLHTLGREYLIDDVASFISERGGKI